MKVFGRELVWKGFWARAANDLSWQTILLGFGGCYVTSILGCAIAFSIGGVWAFIVFFGIPTALWSFWYFVALEKAGVGRRKTPKLDFHDDLGPPIVAELQTWRDPTAPDELVRVTRMRGDSAIIERIAGSAPVTFHKLFPVSVHELASRFDLLRCQECDQPSGGTHTGMCAHSKMRGGSGIVEIGHCIDDDRREELVTAVLDCLADGKSRTTGSVREQTGIFDDELQPVLSYLLGKGAVIQPHGVESWGTPR